MAEKWKRQLHIQELRNVQAIRNHALQFLDQLEMSVDGVDTYQPVAVPSIRCQCCFNEITMMTEGDYYWVRDGSADGVDYEDWYLVYLVAALKVERLGWKFRASCKYCHEELTFEQHHKCVRRGPST